MADDAGVELFGPYGSTQYRTPHLGALAAAGARFTNAFSTPLCTPSRIALMTGRYGVRNYVNWKHLPPSAYTFTEMFNTAGYATAVAGKWQLDGDAFPHRQVEHFVSPADSGFDSYCLTITRATGLERYWQPSIDCDGEIAERGAEEFGPDIFVDFILSFIESNQDHPFFAYYPMMLPHSPIVQPPRPIAQCPDGDDNQCNFEDMVAYLDHNVGRIYDKLDSLGLLDNTILIFTSDNGTSGARLSEFNGAVIAGDKGRPTTGGTHVPLIVLVPGGDARVVDDLIDLTDILPTLAEAIGTQVPDTASVDGVSFWDRLHGRAGQPREWIYTYFFPQPYSGGGGGHPRVAYVRDSRYQLFANGDLFDLEADPHLINPVPETDEHSRNVRNKFRRVLDEIGSDGDGIFWVLVPDRTWTSQYPLHRPIFRSATVEGTLLTLSYAGTIDTDVVPAPAAYTVQVDGAGRPVVNVGVSESKVTLSLASAVASGQAVSVSYAPGQNALRHAKADYGGKAAVPLSSEFVANESPANQAPAFADTTLQRSVAENTAANRNVGAVIPAATDADRDSLTYTLGGTHAASFTFDATARQIQTSAALDFEVKSSYSVTINVSDGNGGTATVAVTISVTDVDEPPEITPADDIVVDENHDGTLATFRASDPENKSGLTYRWSLAGADAADFDLSEAGGVLEFRDSPDADKPADSGRNNVYDITVRALDSDGLSGSIALSVTVRPLNEPPTISGNAMPSLEEEGSLFVGTYQATDQDDATIVWQSLEGNDSDEFEFNSSNGRLEFKAAPDYEAATDLDRNNMYEVTLSASAGGHTETLAVAVTVTNKEEFGSLGFSSPQPQAGAEYTAMLSDPDNVQSTSWTWERSASRNGPWNAVTGATGGRTTSVYTPDDDDVGYFLRVSAGYTDGHGPNKSLVQRSANSVIAAPVTNDPPSFATSTTTREIAEDAHPNATVGAPVTATDTDPDDVLTYTLLRPSLFFTIDRSNGQIRVAPDAMLDHETGPSHTVTVTASDSSNASASIRVTIIVTDVNEPPEASDDSETTDEDMPVTVAVLANDSDPENDVLTVSLGDGPRHGSAAVDPNSYEISYTPHPDYHGSDTLSYVVSDEDGLTDTGEVALEVRAVNDPPRFSGGPLQREVARSAQAGDDVGSPVTATDVDDDLLTYRFSGGDVSFFLIDPVTGQITVGSEVVFDPAVQSEYKVEVEARDRDSAAEVEVTIAVVERVQPRLTGGGGGGGGGPPPVPIPSDIDFDWNVTRDIEALDPGNDLPTGIWSDGETLWVLENSASGPDRVFAYDLRSGERQAGREFELDRRNRFAHGIWSDGETVWIADSGQDQLFAYSLETGERVEERDIELHEDNRDPRGIWSDGDAIYVLDSVRDALFAYDLATGELLAEYPLDQLNRSPRGLWSDGVTLWVSDDGAKRLFAYELDDGALKRNEDLEFTFRSLLKAGNGAARGIWSDEDVIYVADEQDDKVYSYNIPDATIAQLGALSLSDIDIGDFSTGRPDYTAIAAQALSATTVVAAATQPDATVAIEPVDADGDPENGHQVTLQAETAITITVTSADGSRTTSYVVQVSKPPCLDGLTDDRLSEVTFAGGSVSELEACARRFDVSALYHRLDAVWIALFLSPDLPEFLSQPFHNRFPDGLPPGELLIANREPT